MTARALDGVRVLDFSRHLAGPYLTMMLADHGADVIKIEAVEGDPVRTAGTSHGEDRDGPLFVAWNRGKRSVAVDLRDATVLEAVRTLAATADVVVENFRPGVAERIGIGYDALSAINPRLVYCSITGFGRSGPFADLPATDPIGQAMSGVLALTGPPDADPVLIGVPIADVMAAMLGVQAATLALFHRDRTGRGQHVDVSLMFGLMSTLTTRLATFWGTGAEPRRLGGAHSVVLPYQVFPTADGYACAGVWDDSGWPRFCDAIGRPDLGSDPRYRTNAGRVEHRDVVTRELSDTFRTQTNEYWAPRLRAANAMFGPAYGLKELFELDHVVESGIVQVVEHPRKGPIKQLASPISMSDSPPRITTPPPLLGEHTVRVLTEAGLSPDQIDALVAAGTARAAPD